MKSTQKYKTYRSGIAQGHTASMDNLVRFIRENRYRWLKEGSQTLIIDDLENFIQDSRLYVEEALNGLYK